MATSQRIYCCTGNIAERPMVYILRGKQGDMLIDTGMEGCLEQIVGWITENGFDVKWIFLTHGHFDHVWNAAFLRQKYGAEVLLHEKDESLLHENGFVTLKASSASTEYETACANALASHHHVNYCKIDRFITGKDTGYLRKIGFDADIVMLPGHTEGSMGILQGRVMYCGDAVSAKGGDYYTAMFGENVGSIYESEKKIFDLNPLIIAPGHGKYIINEKAFPDKKLRINTKGF